MRNEHRVFVGLAVVFWGPILVILLLAIGADMLRGGRRD